MFKPTFKLTVNQLEGNTAEIIIDPLPQNFGHTIGNALRRVLLSSLEGAAAIRVSIDGVSHQFSTISGMQEDVLEFVLNLKQLRFVLETQDQATVTLNQKGKKIITGSDLELPSGVKLTNPDQILTELTSQDAKISATIEVAKGIGYVPAEHHAVDTIGTIPLDASLSPVLKANYSVEATRVGRRTDLDKVRLTITTDGSIDAKSAVIQAAQILSDFFSQAHTPKFDKKDLISEESVSTYIDHPVEDLSLPIRVINALKKGGYKNISDLKGIVVADLVKVKNIGEKSAQEIVDQVGKKL